MMLTDSRLPTIKRLAGDLCTQSDSEGWPAHRLLEACWSIKLMSARPGALTGTAMNQI